MSQTILIYDWLTQRIIISNWLTQRILISDWLTQRILISDWLTQRILISNWLTGIVSLARSLDREVRDSYNLTLRAMDSGRPRLSAVTKLIVRVLGESLLVNTTLILATSPQHNTTIYYRLLLSNWEEGWMLSIILCCGWAHHCSFCLMKR